MAGDAINFVNFNQDFSCISVGTRNGYNIYNCDPFGKCYSGIDGGMGIVEMLFSTSLVAVVGIGDQPALSPRRLRIVNTKRRNTICELTFPTAVLKVKMNRKRLVVLLEEQIYIYDISNMKLLHTIETSPNPQAICALSPSTENCYLAYPSPAPQLASPFSLPNHVQAATSPSRTGDVIIFDALTLEPVNVIEAHKSPLAAVALNEDGTLLATASDKGTIVRVFSVPGATKLYQFRRGTYPAKIFSINFNRTSSLVSVSSATETVHIFRLARPGNIARREAVDDANNNNNIARNLSEAQPPGSPESTPSVADSEDGSGPVIPVESGVSPALDTYIEGKRRNGSVASILKRGGHSIGRSVAGAMGSYLPNAVTEMWEPVRDFAFIRLPANPGVKSVVALSATNSQAFVVTSEGYFYLYQIDLDKGGECELIKQYSLLDNADLM